MKKVISSFITMMVLTVLMTTTVLIYMPESAKAMEGGCWVGCRLPNGTWSSSNPGNMTGCSVQFGGLIIVTEWGSYDYTCNGQVTTCLYKYTGDACNLTPPLE